MCFGYLFVIWVIVIWNLSRKKKRDKFCYLVLVIWDFFMHLLKMTENLLGK